MYLKICGQRVQSFSFFRPTLEQKKTYPQEPLKDKTMMFFRVFNLWVSIILPLYLQTGDCAEIIGGKKVKLHSLPYMALLTRKINYTHTDRCGGILINQTWVLTAAHCGKIDSVYLGFNNIHQSKIQKIVKRTIPHPDFKSVKKGNDIMLVQLSAPVGQKEHIEALPLPTPVEDLPVGTRCFVAGWGMTKANDKFSISDDLMAANVSVIIRNVCNSKEYYNNDPVITDNMLCAGNDKEIADSCQGDSGGPLMCETELQGGSVLRGIVSFGEGCGIRTKPGIYTFISKYDKWIKDQINEALWDKAF